MVSSGAKWNLYTTVYILNEKFNILRSNPRAAATTNDAQNKYHSRKRLVLVHFEGKNSKISTQFAYFSN